MSYTSATDAHQPGEVERRWHRGARIGRSAEPAGACITVQGHASAHTSMLHWDQAAWDNRRASCVRLSQAAPAHRPSAGWRPAGLHCRLLSALGEGARVVRTKSCEGRARASGTEQRCLWEAARSFKGGPPQAPFKGGPPQAPALPASPPAKASVTAHDCSVPLRDRVRVCRVARRPDTAARLLFCSTRPHLQAVHTPAPGPVLRGWGGESAPRSLQRAMQHAPPRASPG